MPRDSRAQPSPQAAAQGHTGPSHTYISSHCCTTALEPVLGLLSPSSCAGSCVCPCPVPLPVLCAPLSCSSQQHPNKRPREEPVPRTVTSWSAPPWAASATGVCPCLGCAEGMLGGCSGPHHLLWEPSPARGQQGWNHGGSCAVVPVQGQGRAEGNSPCLGPQRAWTWGHPGEHLPFSPASWEITQGPQGRKSWSHNPASHPQGLQGWEKTPFPCPSPAECIPRGAAARAGPLPTQPAPLRETGGTGGAAGSRIWGDPRG